MNNRNVLSQEIIGLIPAGGSASRLSPLPCSKELYPVGFRSVNSNNDLRPKVVSHYLLENMRSANIKKAYVILREGKWDIPSYYRSGEIIDMRLAYLIMGLPYGVPYTLDQAYDFVRHAIVALGFPDILFKPDNAYEKLIIKLQKSQSDIVLGIFPTDSPHKWDMLQMDDGGKILDIHIKPDHTELLYTWGIAIWTPNFTNFMHEYIYSKQVWSGDRKTGSLNSNVAELYVGDVVRAAIREKLKVDTVIFSDGSCLDTGTPDDLIRAMQFCYKKH